MEFDIFFSISQTLIPVATNHLRAKMFSNFLDQAVKADELGFGVGWIAQAHLSTEVQKTNSRPVVPHYPGEVGLCTDFFRSPQRFYPEPPTWKSGVRLCLYSRLVGRSHRLRGSVPFSHCMG